MPFFEGLVPELRNIIDVVNEIFQMDLVVGGVSFHFITGNLEVVAFIGPAEIVISEDILSFHGTDGQLLQRI